MAVARLRIIILDQLANGEYRVCLWANVQSARQPFYANSANTSAWKDALAGDIASLVSGEVAEKVVSLHLAPGESLATSKTAAQSEAAAWQAYVNGYNPWSRYGSSFDGTTWVSGGVA